MQLFTEAFIYLLLQHLLTPFPIIFQDSTVQDMEILSVSVACVTSLSDPIIYAAVNPQFRTVFYKLKNRVSSIFKRK